MNNNKKESPQTTSMNRNKPTTRNPNHGSVGSNPSTMLKRRKSNSLSIIDYCNIINLNTNYQMLATFYDDTEESMARLSMRTTNNKDISKQASLSEQVAALFGSSMCSCYLCNLKSNTTLNQSSSFSTSSSTEPTLVTNNANLSASFSSNEFKSSSATSATTSSAIGRKSQQHNFEIMPNKNNSDFSVMKYTYSTPFSQLSTLKLFNLMNTDCSINFNVEQTQSASKHNGIQKKFEIYFN